MDAVTERKAAKSRSKEKDKLQTDGDPVPNENKKKNGVHVKSFTQRNSILTDLMEVQHFQSVYHMNVAICAVLLMVTVMYYIADVEAFLKDLRMMLWASRQTHISTITWIFLNVICFMFHQILCIWANYRQKQNSKILDFLFFFAFLSVGSAMFVLTPYIVIKADFGLITAFALLAEQVRLFMKLYSFTIENYMKMKRIDGTKDDANKKFTCPSFGHFVYFMFAPTLIYRDSYPRRKERDWGVVFFHFFNVAAGIFIVFCIVSRFNVEIFRHIGIRTFTASELVLMYAGCTVAGSTFMFLLFHTILHSWLNAFAEMMKFGDRLFYKDWWNSVSFAQYYRMWNVVVHEWIYTYLYVHLQNIGVNKHAAMLAVLFASSALHDYIICLALGYFFPILGLVYSTMGFVFLLLTYNKKSQHWNIFLWFALFSGWGCLIFGFTMEWYARKNCPNDMEGIWQYIIPRSFSCPLLAPSN